MNTVYYSERHATTLVIGEDPSLVYPFFSPEGRHEVDLEEYGSLEIDKKDEYVNNGKTYKENIEAGIYVLYKESPHD